MKITVIGTGYVGLVTGTCLSENGNDVLCIDINADKIQKMCQGEIPIYEPHLETLFERNIKANRLNFTTSIEEGLLHGDLIFLALPTPENSDGSADMHYILDVAEIIGSLIMKYKIIITKSTVPVGTSAKVKNKIAENAVVPFDVVSNPEFLREGFAVDDFLKPERIIIGSRSPKAIKIMQKLYMPFVRSGNPIIIMDEKSAELTKYAANAFLATKITFMNEMANYCEKIGANVDSVRIGIGTDSRIGKRFLFPGIGYGGSCFPKDVKALYSAGKEVRFEFKMLAAVMQINQHQKTILLSKIDAYFNGAISGKTFAIWGLAFKPETDDIREAPALVIIENLLKKGAYITAFDPEAMENVTQSIGHRITYASNMYHALENADALIICTEWSIFRTPDFHQLKQKLKTPVIFDGRNLYDVDDMKNENIHYFSIGRQDLN